YPPPSGKANRRLMLTRSVSLVASGSGGGAVHTGITLSMKASSFVGWIPLALLAGIGTMGLSSCSSCKPGKAGKPQAYHMTVNLDESLKQGSVLVDLVGANPANLPRWESYSMTKYWKDGDPMRADAERVTLSFVTGKSLTNEMGQADAKWAK